MHINESGQLVNGEAEDFKVGKDLITPHKDNFDSNPNHINTPELIIMHYTGGMEMESTINTFKNPPSKPDSAASAHLLIGRDGSVVQFVPFNRIAYHTGFASWEGNSELNKCSIGIELDNVGQLAKKDGKWQVARLKPPIIIQDEQVEQREYWKANLPKEKRDDPVFASKLPGFQKFTDIQLTVAFNIIQALVKNYPGIKDILGHDQINLALREDPGPLLPMPEWRKILFGREEPKFEEFIINQPTDIFANDSGKLPNTQTTVIGRLPENSLVNVQTEEGGFALVTVIKSSDPKVKGKGWVLSNFLQDSSVGKKRKTTRPQNFFKAGVGLPTVKLIDGLPFPAGTRVRIQGFHGDLALVAMLDRLDGLGAPNDHGKGGLEGWMRKDFLSPKDGQP